jgi:hypothetical protein
VETCIKNFVKELSWTLTDFDGIETHLIFLTTLMGIDQAKHLSGIKI